MALMPRKWGNGRGGRPWRRLVEAVKRRDQFICQACGYLTEKGHCDHIVPLSNRGTDDLVNLQWLCIPCSEAKTQIESGEARGLKQKIAIGEDGWPK